MKMSTISDSEILTEYIRRFSIAAGESIKTARDAADHFRSFFANTSDQEQFVCAFVNSQHQLLSTEVLFVGSIDSSAVYPREVVKKVLKIKASAVFFGHNHPSSNVAPSSSDRAVTKKLQRALNAIDVDVLDHIIIGGADYFSFADHRLL